VVPRARAARRTSPLLADDLEPAADPALDDGEEWQGLAVTGDLSGRVAARVDISGCRIAGASFVAAELPHLRLRDVVLEDCDLAGAVLDDVVARRVELRRCRLTGLVASRSRWQDVAFVDCHLDDATFRRVMWERAELIGCRLRRADLTGSRFTASALLRCDLTGAVLSEATMAGTRLHGSTVEELVGAEGLRGVVIGRDQVVAVGAALLAGAGVLVDDEGEGEAGGG
jgi:uncharacterized protein YjbI with pentapeptide repeats